MTKMAGGAGSEPAVCHWVVWRTFTSPIGASPEPAALAQPAGVRLAG